MIYEKRDFEAYIEYKGNTIVKVTHGIIFKKFSKDYNLVTMDKSYQNDNKNEQKEINTKLQDIYNKKDTFILNCLDDEIYVCEFLSDPTKLNKMEAKIC